MNRDHDADHSDQMMRSMLSGADRPRRLTDDERARLEQSLANTRGLHRGGDRSGRQAVWASVAAAVAIVAGIGLLAQQRSPTTVTTATTTAATTEPTTCQSIAPALEAAIVAWGTIDDWSLASNPSPDLAELALDRIEARPSDASPALRSDLATTIADGPTATPAQSAERLATIRAAIAQLLDDVRGDQTFCPSPILEAAAAGAGD